MSDSSKIIYVRADGALLGLTEKEYLAAIRRGKVHIRNAKQNERALKKYEGTINPGKRDS